MNWSYVMIVKLVTGILKLFDFETGNSKQNIYPIVIYVLCDRIFITIVVNSIYSEEDEH